MLNLMERTTIKQEINISESLMERINELLSHYPSDKKKSALLPVLHAVQDTHAHWVSVELMDKVAEISEIHPIEVYEVVTFYTMYAERPRRKYPVELCRTSCCMLRRAEDM